MLSQLMERDKISAIFLHNSTFPVGADVFYVSGFECELMSVLTTKKGSVLFTTGFETPRAKKEARIKDVREWEDYGYMDFVRKTRDRPLSLLMAMREFFRKERISKIWVPKGFPAFFYDGLKKNVKIEFLSGIFEEARCVKKKEELDEIAASQLALEAGMQKAIDMIRDSRVKNGKLFDGKKPITEWSLKSEISKAIMEKGAYEPIGNIVACGAPASDPHYIGGKVQLREKTPIVIDLFPRLNGLNIRSMSGTYWSDCTRTVSKGKPDEKIIRAYNAVCDANEACLDSVKAGMKCSEANAIACDVIESRGFETLRKNPKTKEGFIHGLGHGVGLEIHERPTLSHMSNDVMKENYVVTIEPGLYYRSWGGIRIEDMVVVKKNGAKNFCSLDKEFVV